MSIMSGTKLGPYEITGAIGAGGMGEVYRARDPKLGRDVAIKVLPEAFARDAERMARFQREAKVLASLSHPNIATIYGLEDSGSTRALVMELVEGPTLAERIKAGPIPVDESVRIAKQIADALEYAHERGIIHRDLKPANVKVTNDDAVKVLDFGLAKALEGDPSSIDISTSPTISRMATQAGVLLGTAAYMSPEQAKAKTVDRRADIWAFGCVLFEMLTGKVAFPGESVTDTLAGVIRAEPDWSLLPSQTPMRVRVLLQRCLQKDAKQRLRDIGDARISLEEVLSGAPEGAPSLAATGRPVTRRWFWPVAAVAGALVVGVALGGVTIWNLRPSPPKPVTRFTIALPPGQRLAGLSQPALALSPDGSKLAYVAMTQGGGAPQIYLREMDSEETRAVSGTEGAREPFFSPDGRWLGFFTEGKLKKVSVSGGAAVTLGDAANPLGASWGSQGIIVFVPNLGTLQQVSDAGGAPQPLTRFEKVSDQHFEPEFLPNAKAVLFAHSQPNGIAVETLGTGARRNLIQGGYSPGYAPSGHLVYAQGGSLMAVPFDPERLEVKGEAVPVVQGVLSSGLVLAAQYSLSATGSLVYVSGSALQSKLVWVSRSGAEQPLAAPARNYGYPRLSPDGRRVAVAVEGRVWLYDLARDTLSQFTFERRDSLPVWTPDGKRIAFLSSEGGPANIFWQLADGSGGLEQLTNSEYNDAPLSFSPDGQVLAFQEFGSANGFEISLLRLSDRKPQAFIRLPANGGAPQFSPDGHWLAYVSEESGRYEIYVQPYPGSGGKWRISTDGGSEPVWNRNGRELFYRSEDKVMAVEITTQPSFSAGKPKELFEGRYLRLGGTFPFYDVSPDGLRFLMLKPVQPEAAAPTQINVVLNWTEELKRLVPTGTK
jgi:serine/threonine protein kinase/Tol biopolymer transport system component